MCRLLAVIADRIFEPSAYLEIFAAVARDSREYQGHGWGCAIRERGGAWQLHRSITPIWEDSIPELATTSILLAHARSAYRDESIAVENNMPFAAGDDVFIFNGELHGVRIREEGRIGAEKVFNYIRRFRDRGLAAAIEHGSTIIEKRCEYVRAMNTIIADDDQVCVRCRFNEDPEYFTMHERPPTNGDGTIVICSDPFPGESGWRPIGDGEMRTYPCS